MSCGLTGTRIRRSTVRIASLSCRNVEIHRVADLLRVIRKGHTVKNAVDDAIDQCSEVFNLRDSIEEARNLAEQATDERQKRRHAQRGSLYGPSAVSDTDRAYRVE